MIQAGLEHPALGWIPRREDLGVKSRHLGLFMAHETESLAPAGTVIEENTDLNGIIAAAQSAPHIQPGPAPEEKIPERVRIGIACDNAFCFYYQDNLDRLREAGARLEFFSPLGSGLPEVDAVYLGGGYPELYLSALESSPCTNDLKRAAEKGMPIYAECGGLMYLTREVAADRSYFMTGILPADTEMTKKIQALGYVKGMVCSAGSILSLDRAIAGHEFHYSRLLPDPDARYAIRLNRGKGIDSGQDGLTSGSALGSYTHAYFSRETAADITGSALRFSRC